MSFFQNRKKSKALLALNAEYSKLTQEVARMTAQKIAEHPVNKLRIVTKRQLVMLRDQRNEMDDEYTALSTWQKLNAPLSPFAEIDSVIQELEALEIKIDRSYAQDSQEIKAFYLEREQLVLRRIENARDISIRMINVNEGTLPSAEQTLHYGMWGATIGVATSLAHDVYQAHGLYDALRRVNGNFSDMSDLEIWWESIWMSEGSLSGLASLAKGAYFEQLVADDTGGILFDNFNHEATDIVIEGNELQLKATDSISYINSVDDDITLMATSEIAERSAAIDSGISNLELSETVDLALGGAIIDAGDGVIDGVMGAFGGLGTIATIRGIGHAAERYNNGGDGAEAIEEGLGVAVKGTVKGVCDMGDMVYGAATSNTGKAIGRGALKTGEVGVRILGKGVGVLDRLLSKYV